MKWLVWLYPRAWRRRYGDEFEALLEQRALTPAAALDVIRGAVDAHRMTMFGQEDPMPGVLRRLIALSAGLLTLVLGFFLMNAVVYWLMRWVGYAFGWPFGPGMPEDSPLSGPWVLPAMTAVVYAVSLGLAALVTMRIWRHLARR